MFDPTQLKTCTDKVIEHEATVRELHRRLEEFIWHLHRWSDGCTISLKDYNTTINFMVEINKCCIKITNRHRSILSFATDCHYDKQREEFSALLKRCNEMDNRLEYLVERLKL